MRRIALASLAVCCSMAASADQGIGASGTKSHLDLQITVPQAVRVEVMRQPATITIGARDLAKGYVDGRATVVLTSNTDSGYRLCVRFDSGIVSRVEIRLQGQVLSAVGPETAVQVLAPKMWRSPIQVDYRLYLSPDAKEGVYAWPTRMEFAPGA